MPEEIVGRERELAALARFMDELPEGPSALVIEGEAGVGKTTLFDAALSRAEGLEAVVLASRPAESDAAFSFSGLSDLLAAQLGRVADELPGPQLRALRVALLLDPAPVRPPEPHTVAAAVRTALRTLARERIVLVAIDDVQWLDSPTAEVLAFALRRVEGERIGVLCATRSDVTDRLPLGLDRSRLPTELVAVHGLSAGALHRLLLTRVGTAFSRPMLSRIAAESGGNPFIALELAQALNRRGTIRVDPGAPLIPETVGGLVKERLDSLPPKALEFLRVVALMADPTEERASALVEDPSGFDAALTAGILEVDGRSLRFSHPLLASAVVSAIPNGRRRELHALLAAGVSDGEERARHLALAADGPSESTCVELESAAGVAAARGAPAGAAELLVLAAQLTEPGSEEIRWRRKFEAANFYFLAGEARASQELLEELIESMPPGPERADALARLALGREDDVPAAVRLIDQALREAGDDPARRADIHIAHSYILSVLGESTSARAEARLALAAAEHVPDDALLASALAQVVTCDLLCGHPIDHALLDRSLALEHDTGALRSRTSPSFVAGLCYLAEGSLDRARQAFEAALARAEAEGVEYTRADTLLRLSLTEGRAGNLERSEELAAGGLEVAEQLGLEQITSALLYGCGMAALLRGRPDEARDFARRGLELSVRAGDDVFATANEALLALTDLTTGEHDRAANRFAALWGRMEGLGRRPSVTHGMFANTVEALIAAGRLGEARAAVAKLEWKNSDPVAAPLLARCRGALAAADGMLDVARRELEAGLRLHDAVPFPLERARTLLVLGAVQRRLKQRREARSTLGEALEILERIGAPLWAEKARAELARIGGRRPAGALTTAELRVAELAAQGSSNKEIAAELFVTVKTVEAALSRVYRKLGVRSRASLGRVLTEQTVGESPLSVGPGRT